MTTTPATTPRLAIVLSHPTQYYSPWFRWLASHADLQLRVFYLWDSGIKVTKDVQFGKAFAWDVDLLSGYEHEFVPNTSTKPGTEHFSGLRNPSLTSRLKAWKPDAVLLFGYNYNTHLRLILWATLRRIPLIFRGDSHLLGRGKPPFTKRFPLELLYGRFTAFAAVGTANRDYFRTFGVPEKKLFTVPHCVNAEHFTATPAYLEQTARLRTELGLDGKRVILFAGKFVPAKQPLELLRAFLAIDENIAANTALVFVGDGQDRDALQQLAAANPSRTVRFLPFANQSEMPSRCLLADVFVLPSKGLYETWGLAVNEAMHLGVPCLVSDRVGCQQDLITHGETGWVFRAEDPAALKNALTTALTDIAAPEKTDELGARIAERISHFTYATATTGLQRAVNFALSRSS